MRTRPLFVQMTPDEVAFMESLKIDEAVVEPGATIQMEGSASPRLFTVLQGQGLRYKTLPNGRRQIICFVFPGDFLGLQAALLGEMQHSVEARTRMMLCVFDQRRVVEVFEEHPSRARSLSAIAAVEGGILGETLASLGQRDAAQRIAWALTRVWNRLGAIGLERDGAVPLTFRQQDMADFLGLSLVHTNKTLARFRQGGLCDWSDGTLRLHDPEALARLAHVEPARPAKRHLM
ncbi:CRP-like cAMP-binding protein [Rubellimicrobium aerolatum]|nr:CRP-like cAMP-binding protein [Rubellimicrobium aerolatum]